MKYRPGFTLVIWLVIILGIAAFFYFNPKKEDQQQTNTSSEQQQNNFDRIGNVVRNNPGLTPNVWYLVSESTGVPVQTYELRFASEPKDLVSGMRVRVVGLEQNNVVTVQSIEIQKETQTVKLFYYNSSQDRDPQGNILCSKKGLASVNRTIEKTNTPIQDTINLLLEGNLTAQERASGISTEFPLEGVKLIGANLKSGVLTLEFSDPKNMTGGGSCRVAVLWAQIEATAKQFPQVSQVKFMPEELFQP